MFDPDKDIIGYLTPMYDIHWFYFANEKSLRVPKNTIEEYAKTYNVRLHWLSNHLRQLSPKRFLYMIRLALFIKKLKPYKIIKVEQDLYWSLASKLILRVPKIYFIHDVLMHSGTHNRRIRQLFSYLTFRMNHNFLFFSNSQASIFKQMYKNKNVYATHMSVKDFGKPTLGRPSINKGIKLLFFGRIEYNKGLDSLITSLEQISNNGISNITLSICGKGSYWPTCQKMLKSNKLYNLQVRFIKNEEIPNLFNSHHFLVLPYRDATQSGPIMIAANYGLPIVASNLKSFHEIYPQNCAIYYSELSKCLTKLSKMTQEDYNILVSNCQLLKNAFSAPLLAKGISEFISKAK